MSKRKIQIILFLILVPAWITAMLINTALTEKKAEENAAGNFVETFHKDHPDYKPDIITKISDSVLNVIAPPAPAATVYYVNFSTGNDLNNGTSTATPWKNLSKVNGFTFAAGDIIKFARGEKWYGAITVPRSDLTFDAYGTGALPVISGFTNITSWTPAGGGKWFTNLASADSTFTVFTVNDTLQQMARYPDIDAADKGYLPYKVVDTNTIRGTVAGNWAGKRLVMKSKMWRIQNALITADKSDTLNFRNFEYFGYGTTAFMELGQDDNGYFFVDDTTFLTKRGEFKYQKNVNRLYSFFGSENPNALTCKASTQKILFNVGSRNNIIIQNIRFEGANQAAIAGSTVAGAYIDSVEINNCTQGICFYRLSNSNIRYPTISNCLQNAIYVRSLTSPYTNVNIEHFNISNIGLMPGMGSKNQDCDYVGVYAVVYSGLNVRYGRVNECGIDCVKFGGTTNLDVSYNELSGACNVAEDHGLIYTYNVVSGDGQITNVNVHHNILYNSYGSPEGVNNNVLYANGIYLDGYNQGVNVYKNIFKGNIARNNIVCNIRNDVNLYDNIGVLDQPGSRGFSLSNIIGRPMGMTVKRNVWFMPLTGQSYFYYVVNLGSEDLFDNLTEAITSYDSNYVNRIDQNGIYTIEYYTPGLHKDLHTLAEWQAFSGFEIHAIPITTDDPDSVYLAYNNTFATKAVALPTGTWKDVKTDSVFTGSKTFASFEGALFQKVNDVITPPAPSSIKIKGIKTLNSNQL